MKHVLASCTQVPSRKQHSPRLRRSSAAAMAAFVACALVVAGCGTTVSPAERRADSAGGGLAPTTGSDSTAPQQSEGSGSTVTQPSTGSGPSVTVSGGSTVTTTGGDATGTGTGGRAVGPPSTVSGGVASSTINIGFEVSDADEAFNALGFGNLTTGNTENQVNALVRYLNSQGGLAGRTIKPVLYKVPTTSSGNNAQTECAHFTQDNKVFAVIGNGAGSSLDLIRCLAKGNTIYIDGYGSLDDASARSVRGYWYDPADFVLDRFVRHYVDQLVELGYFTPNAKIGLLSYDDPRFRDVVAKVLKPALARHGLQVADEALYSTSAYASQSSGFVLKFQAGGITHVLNLVAGVVVFFQLAAENQQYRPRYALSSRDGPGSFIQVLSPHAQLRGSLGIGWQPFADVDLANSPGDVSPNQALCRDIMKRAGEDTSNGGVLVTTGRYCETTFFLRAALQRATAFTAAGMLSAVGKLASAYPPVTTFKTFFDDTRPDGPTQVRPFSFGTDCSCFRYTGPKRELPTR